MTMYVLFLVLCALLGALVAAYIGYRQNDNDATMYELYGAFASGMMCLIACFGPIDKLPIDGESISSGFFVIGLIWVMMMYYKALIHCAFWGEDLQYPVAVRQERRAKRYHKTKRKVITVEAIARAIRMAEAREVAEKYDKELEKLSDLADGIEWIDLDKEDDPVSVVAEIIQRVQLANSRVPRPRPTAKPSAPAPRVIMHPAAASTVKALVKHLDSEDLHLVTEAFRREPALLYMLRSNELFARMEIVGQGDQKRIKIKGAVYTRKKVV